MLTTAGLVLLAGFGCWLGRALGPRLKTCPYVLSAQCAAVLPVLVALCALDSLGGVRALLVAVGAVVGVFASGHNSRTRSVLLCLVGAATGGLAGVPLG